MPLIRVKEETPILVAPKSNRAQACTTSGRGTDDSSDPSIRHQASNSKCPREGVRPRRSARLASKYKYTVPTDKPIVPSEWLLEREELPRGIGIYKHVKAENLSKPGWTGASGPNNRKLRREYSFVLVDCGSHFEMVSPKAVGHFARVPQCFGTMAPYHKFGRDIGEEDLKKKLGAKLVTAPAASELSRNFSTNQKRRRSEDDESAATGINRPVKKAKTTKANGSTKK